MENWHRHLGVYGICAKDSKLLVIHKKLGPYKNRFDLPGGSVEQHESLIEGIHREFAEETGIQIEVIKNIGVTEYLVPYVLTTRNTTHIHHIAIFYEVTYKNDSCDIADEIKNNETIGAEWIDLNMLNEHNCSPLVLEALTWLKTNYVSSGLQRLDEWIVI